MEYVKILLDTLLVSRLIGPVVAQEHHHNFSGINGTVKSAVSTNMILSSGDMLTRKGRHEGRFGW